MGYISLENACDTLSLPCFKDSMCGNGKCDTTISQCKCDSGWTFSSLTCDGCTDTTSCGEHGTSCNNNNICVCEQGWGIGSSYKCDVDLNANACQSAGYPNYCKNSGICSLDSQNKPTCTCPESGKWYGDRCEVENYCYQPDVVCPNANETCVINQFHNGSSCENINNICPSCSGASSTVAFGVLVLFIVSLF